MAAALAAVLLSLMLGGCAASTRSSSDALVATRDADLTHGYSLLYSLISKQSNLDKVLILKNASQPSKTLIKQIAQASAAAKKQIEELAKLDPPDSRTPGFPALVLDDEGLPAIESATRAAIESATRKQLLFGGGGGESFELRLLLTQVEATRYGAALARQLAATDPDAARVSWLTSFAQQYEELNRDVLDQLAVRTTRTVPVSS